MSRPTFEMALAIALREILYSRSVRLPCWLPWQAIQSGSRVVYEYEVCKTFIHRFDSDRRLQFFDSSRKLICHILNSAQSQSSLFSSP